MFIAYEASTINNNNLATIKHKLKLSRLGSDLNQLDDMLTNALNKKDDLFCIVFDCIESFEDRILDHTIVPAWLIDEMYHVAISTDDEHIFWITKKK